MQADSDGDPATWECTSDNDDEQDTEGASSAHDKRMQKAAEGWNEIRDSLLRIAVEMQCIPK